MIRRPPRSTLFPYTTLFRSKIDYPDPILNRRLSVEDCVRAAEECGAPVVTIPGGEPLLHKEIGAIVAELVRRRFLDRKSTRLNSSHANISYAVFCLKKKNLN